MLIKYFQKGFNYSQDGPGNRLVIHLQGCALKCPWCANPEGMSPEGVLMTADKINGSYCPRGAVDGGSLNRELCRGCEMPCLSVPASGLKLSCESVDTHELVRYVKSCEMMFFDSGGVTLTGGEPTLQFDALGELLTKLKAEGIHTALETNGTHPRLPELFPLIDFLITDCKHYDPVKFSEVCGGNLNVITGNIAKAAAEREQLLIRTPLIGGFNADEADAEGFVKLFREIASPACSFEFLRYHEFGKDKYKKCGMTYTPDETAKVPPERVAYFREILKNNGFSVIST